MTPGGGRSAEPTQAGSFESHLSDQHRVWGPQQPKSGRDHVFTPLSILLTSPELRAERRDGFCVFVPRERRKIKVKNR